MEQEKIDKIIELYKLGVPKTKIAKQMNCSTPTVLKYIRQVDVIQEDPMIGKTFGLLTVLERAPKREDLISRCIRYKCKCQCGNVIEVDGGALRNNHTRSCGCTRKINIPYTDLKNQCFGKLTVLYLKGSNNNRKIWHCKCDCGNECDIDSHSLISGSTKSCGCLHSYKEIEIEQILDRFKIQYVKEYTFSDLRGKRNPLRFDFAIKQNDNLICLIEYQGDQHFDINNNWHTKQLEDSDIKKKDYCNNNNIPLYELTKYDNLEERLKEILNNYGYKL